MVNLKTPSRSSMSDAPNRAARRRYTKIAEAAEYLGVTDRTIRQMIADGRLIGYRSGTRLVRVDLDQIDAAMRPFGGAA
jgi:excisionase family DNA binding protein